MKEKRQQFQRGGRRSVSELTLIEEIVELSAEELIFGDDTSEILKPKLKQDEKKASKATPKKPAPRRSPFSTASSTSPSTSKRATTKEKPSPDPDAIRSKATSRATTQKDAAKPSSRADVQTPLPASTGSSRSGRIPTRPEPLARRGQPSPRETAIGVRPQIADDNDQELFPAEVLTPLPRAKARAGSDTSPEIEARSLPELVQTRPDVEAVPADVADDVLTEDDAIELAAEDAIEFAEEPAPQAKELGIELRLRRIDLARQNYEVLQQHLATHSTDQLCLDDEGKLATSAASAATIVVPQSLNGSLVSLCVPAGLAKDQDGQLCEAYLVLRKLPNEAPVWSHALASIQATEQRTLHFVEWSPVKEEMLYLLNDEQREQLLYLLAPEFSSILQDPLYPPDDHKKAQSLRLKPTPLPMKAPERPAKASIRLEQPEAPRTTAAYSNKLPPSRPNPAAAVRSHDPVTPTPSPSPTQKGRKKVKRRKKQGDAIIDVTKPARGPSIFDDTAIRRIQLKTAALDPDALRLHVNIPGSLHGQGFQPVEEILQIADGHNTLKLPLLGLKLEFTYNQGASGKVFPRIVVTRSTNVRGIQYAAYEIGLYANKNPREETGFDHVQELPRGHMASVDLSPTDQLRGIMLLAVAPPPTPGQTTTHAQTIHCSWSVVE